MDEPTNYTIHHEPLFGLLEVMDVQRVIDDTTEPWVNWTLCGVNDTLIRLGVLQGEFHWHKHDEEDEFFLLLDGEFRIELEDRTVELKPRQAFTPARGRAAPSNRARPQRGDHDRDSRRGTDRGLILPTHRGMSSP